MKKSILFIGLLFCFTSCTQEPFYNEAQSSEYSNRTSKKLVSIYNNDSYFECYLNEQKIPLDKYNKCEFLTVPGDEITVIVKHKYIELSLLINNEGENFTEIDENTFIYIIE
jgi:hypothetical protein